MAIIRSRSRQYLISKRPGVLPQGVPAADLAALEHTLQSGGIPGCSLKKVIRQRGVGALAAAGGESDAVLVAELDEPFAAQLTQHPGLVVERDELLTYETPSSVMPPVADPSVVRPTGTGFSTTIIVQSEDGEPIEDAEVLLYGSLWPVQGVTDAEGRVQLTMLGGSLDTIRALYVKPRADHWDRRIEEPMLDADDDNVIFLAPLKQTFTDFPQRQMVGWGLKAMKIDQLPGHYRGQGVKIAVIDSGAATSHQDLERPVRGGYDTTSDSADGWNVDPIAHGSHCAGVVAGNLDNAVGVRGIAPDTEVMAIKIFPGGRFSNLIDAIDVCMQAQVDVINLSLGSSYRSQLVERKIQEAKRLGTACIVAAGNSAGPVQYPAASPQVLAVSAIGKHGEYPIDSQHSAQESKNGGARTTPEGYFSPKFSCRGPEIGVCAPGVAIVSSVPPNNYAAWDGTSMAAPHVSGLAALILAHHPDFRGTFRMRDARRVDRLFQIIRECARPIDLGDPYRTGAGLPDALRALQVQTETSRITSEFEKLVAQICGQRVPDASDATRINAAMASMQSAMVQNGLLNGMPANGFVTATPASSPAPAPPSPESLRTTMERVGLMNDATALWNVAAFSTDTSPGIAQLRETIERVGLLR